MARASIRILSRRRFAKLAVSSACAVASPFIVRNARAQGSLTVATWEGEIPSDLRDAFGKQTQIEVSTIGVADADEMISLLANGRADVAYVDPSDVPRLSENTLLQRWDEQLASLILPRLLFASDLVGGSTSDGRFAIPSSWTSEALEFRKEALGNEGATYEVMWGRTATQPRAFRPRTAILTAGLLLQARDQIAGLAHVYDDEAQARAIIDKATELVIQSNPNQFKSFFWKSDEAAEAFFTQQGVPLGQVREGVGWRLLQESGSELKYAVPKEGGLGWIDCMVLSSKSEHAAEATEWSRFMLSGASAARLEGSSSWNSASNQALPNLTSKKKSFLESTHPQLCQSTVDGGDPCKVDTCRCNDGTCSKDCCTDSSIVANVFWQKRFSSAIVQYLSTSADKIAAS